MKPSLCHILMGLLILFSLSSAHSLENQLVITPEKQFDYANTLLKTNDYSTAVVEFKRYVHFFPHDSKINDAKFYIALCLFHLKQYHEAAAAFNQIILENKDHNKTSDAYFYQSDAFLKLGNTGYAQIVLQNYLLLTDDIDIKDKIFFKLGQLHMSLSRQGQKDALSSAKKYFSLVSESGKVQFNTDQYIDLIARAQKAPKKNPTAAGIFAVLPGAGFLYCERYEDAFITFLLNTGLIIAAWQAYENDNEALAGVIGFVETGFYSGNIYGSISSAHKYNNAQVLKILGQEINLSSKIQPDKNGYALFLDVKF